MSTMFRVDPRLVHATTVSGWVPALSATGIVVLDREAAADRDRRRIMELSTIGEVDLVVVPELEAKAALDARAGQGATLCLFSNLRAVVEAKLSGLELPELVIGHLPSGPGRDQLHPAVWFGPDDHAIVQQLTTDGTQVFVCALPGDPMTPIHELAPPMCGPSPRDSFPSLREGPPPRTSSAPKSGDAVASTKVTIVNSRGLHLRAAHALVQLASELSSDILVRYDGEEASARSLLSLTGLGAAQGAEVEITARGGDAADSLDRVVALFLAGFNETGDLPGVAE